jgi:outer membrane protein assembly factor BamA
LTNYWGDPATTPLSSTLVSASFTTKRQVLVVARADLYAPNDTWHLLGDWRFYRFNERTHGLGSDRPILPSVNVDYDWFRAHQTIYRPLWLGLEAGVGYHLDVHSSIELADTQETTSPPDLQPAGSESTTSSGLSVNLVFDTRDNPLNADRGLLARASYTFYRTGFGSDSDWDSLQLEGRAFHRLPSRRRQTIGVWALGWLTRAGEPPYFDLPSVGWDTYGRTGRGYRAGRFRGRDWVYAEAEYRTAVTRDGLIGAVAFANVSTFSDNETRRFGRWRPGGGLGTRIKLDKERRSNIGVDLAWGQEGSVGLYLALNEAF